MYFGGAGIDEGFNMMRSAMRRFRASGGSSHLTLKHTKKETLLIQHLRTLKPHGINEKL